MCFYKDDVNQRASIAEKDIVCWKAIRKQAKKRYTFEALFNSMHGGFVYKEGKVYTEKRFVIRRGYIELIYGFHSLKHRNLVSTYIDGCWVFSKWRTVRCIIPKGSKYMISKDGEIISNKLMIPKQ